MDLSTITQHFAQQGALPSFLCTAAGMALLEKARSSPVWLSFFAFPGVLAHECLHYVVGLLTRARPVAFSVWPRREGSGLVLGEVSFSNLGLLNGAPVAFAPLLLYPLGIWLLLSYGAPWWRSGDYLQWGGICLGTASLFFAGRPSWQDVRAGGASALFYAALAGAAWYLQAQT